MAESRIARRKGKCGGRYTFHNTRIWVTVIRTLLADGYTSGQILRMYPDLESADLEAARQFRERRG